METLLCIVVCGLLISGAYTFLHGVLAYSGTWAVVYAAALGGLFYAVLAGAYRRAMTVRGLRGLEGQFAHKVTPETVRDCLYPEDDAALGYAVALGLVSLPALLSLGQRLTRVAEPDVSRWEAVSLALLAAYLLALAAVALLYGAAALAARSACAWLEARPNVPEKAVHSYLREWRAQVADGVWWASFVWCALLLTLLLAGLATRVLSTHAFWAVVGAASLVGAGIVAANGGLKTLAALLRTWRTLRPANLDCRAPRPEGVAKYDAAARRDVDASATGMGFLLILPAWLIGLHYLPGWFAALVGASAVAIGLAECTRRTTHAMLGGTRSSLVKGLESARDKHDWHGCQCRLCGGTRNAGHEWDGCRCATCGKTRDQGHQWDGCTCLRCGALDEAAHDWSHCRCVTCGKARDAEHDWDGCKCRVCDKTREEGHAWAHCRCARCGKARDSGHDWDGCKCRTCGKTRDEGHAWDACTCTRCGRLRHDWGESCKCSRCAATRDIGHEWRGCTCALCQTVRDEGHQWQNGRCTVCGAQGAPAVDESPELLERIAAAYPVALRLPVPGICNICLTPCYGFLVMKEEVKWWRRLAWTGELRDAERRSGFGSWETKGDGAAFLCDPCRQRFTA
jgi:hypothetical protein